MFSETSVHTTATRYKVPEDIYNFYRRDNIPEDSVRRPQIVFLYGEANQQLFHGNSCGVLYHPKEP
jgi:hypothetical protein